MYSFTDMFQVFLFVFKRNFSLFHSKPLIMKPLKIETLKKEQRKSIIAKNKKVVISINWSYYSIVKQLCLDILQLAITCSKIKNGNTKSITQICSKLPIKSSKRRHWHHSGFFVVNFEIDYALNLFRTFLVFFIVDFEQVNAVLVLNLFVFFKSIFFLLNFFYSNTKI